MAGIYIHIPFCKSKCIYCDFYSETDRLPDSRFIKTLEAELKQKSGYLPSRRISAVYFGGGTPSLLAPKSVEHLIQTISEQYILDPHAEITLEANPDDLNKDYLKALSETSVNRLSIGIQSFDDKILKFLKRRHSGSQAKAAVLNAKAAGFFNISGDLIYSVPGMSGEIWRETLKQFFELDIPHLSAYDLIYEEDTLLSRLKNQSKIKEVSDNKSEEYFTLLRGESEKHGFEHYELSNFAKIGFHSRHNSSYWKSIPYLGLGPGAHSFNGKSRQWNISNLNKWEKAVADKSPYYETENLSIKDRFNEFLITRLRTASGLSFQELTDDFGKPYCEYLIKRAEKLPESNAFVINNKSLSLKKDFWFLSDNIIVKLLLSKAL
jgi:putative oxygen-independent coproporphyrinogen III oxidase